MAIEIREDSLNSGSLQSGLGVPTHLASTGTLFTDKSTGIIYINKNGSSLWSNISTSAATGGGSITSFAYSPTNNTFSIVESGVTYSAAINSMSGLTISNLLTVPTISATTYQNLPNTLYTGDGNLSGNRIVGLGSNTLRFSGASRPNAIFINSSGQVGINNSSPNVALDVSGNCQVVNTTLNSSDNILQVTQNNINTTSSSYDAIFAFRNQAVTLNSYSLLTFQQGPEATGIARIGSRMIAYGGSNVNNYQGNLVFQVRNGGSIGDSMVLRYDGNLGIGTTSPSFKLDVSGDTRVVGGLTANTFSGVSDTISGTRGRVVTSGSSTTALISMSGSNTIGGANYVDFIRVTNTFVGATNINKTIRLDSAGAIEFLNSAYSALTFSIADNGFVNITSPASTSSNIAVNNALNVGTNGQLFDDGNFHIHAKTGSLWINALEGNEIRLGTQTNKGTSSVIVDTSIVGHSFFTKVQSGFNVAFGTEITMDNLKVRINGTGGSNGLVQAGSVSGSFSAYSTLLGNVAGSALRGDTNSAGITFTTSYQDISSAQATLAAGGDVTTLHLIDTTNSRIYRITAIHCQGTTGGYTSIERMA